MIILLAEEVLNLEKSLSWDILKSMKNEEVVLNLLAPDGKIIPKSRDWLLYLMSNPSFEDAVKRVDKCALSVNPDVFLASDVVTSLIVSYPKDCCAFVKELAVTPPQWFFEKEVLYNEYHGEYRFIAYVLGVIRAVAGFHSDHPALAREALSLLTEVITTLSSNKARTYPIKKLGEISGVLSSLVSFLIQNKCFKHDDICYLFKCYLQWRARKIAQSSEEVLENDYSVFSRELLNQLSIKYLVNLDLVARAKIITSLPVLDCEAKTA